MDIRTLTSKERIARWRVFAILIRLVFLTIALIVWIGTAGGRLRNRRFAVLCYHGIPGSQRAEFEWQMKRIKDRAASIGELNTRLTGHGVPRIVVTFDDAFANLLPNALPIIEQAGVPCAIFAVSANLGIEPMWRMSDGHPDRHQRVMTEEELKRTADMGLVTIGSHSATHRALDTVSEVELQRELRQSKESLERLVGGTVSDLALPYGAGAEQVSRVASESGYRRVFTLEHDLERGGTAGIIGRFSISPSMWPIEFVLTIDGAYGWLGSFRRLIRCRGLSLRAAIRGADSSRDNCARSS